MLRKCIFFISIKTLINSMWLFANIEWNFFFQFAFKTTEANGMRDRAKIHLEVG